MTSLIWPTKVMPAGLMLRHMGLCLPSLHSLGARTGCVRSRARDPVLSLAWHCFGKHDQDAKPTPA